MNTSKRWWHATWELGGPTSVQDVACTKMIIDYDYLYTRALKFMMANSQSLQWLVLSNFADLCLSQDAGQLVSQTYAEVFLNAKHGFHINTLFYEIQYLTTFVISNLQEHIYTEKPQLADRWVDVFMFMCLQMCCWISNAMLKCGAW